MGKLLIIAVLVFAPFLISAQINISVQLPPAGLIQKNQLWNLVLVNNREDIHAVSLKMSLQNAQTGEVTFTAVTGAISINKGIKILSERDIQPLQYSYNDPAYSKTYLPIGTYIACYRVYEDGAKTEQPLGDECIKITIEPLSPPMLNSPTDTAIVQTPYPQFTWLPPAPFDMFNNLLYNLTIFEMEEHQKPIEAIRYNIPVYVRTNLRQTFENYNSSYAKLEEGKSYAWQVTAVNDLNYSATTEVWSFRINSNKIIEKPENKIFVLLTGEDSKKPVYNLPPGDLSIKFYSYDKQYKGDLVFRTIDNKIIQTLSTVIHTGENYFTLKLNNEFQSGKTYSVELKNPEENIFKAFFNSGKK